ncbi:MAG: M18 family aminopeptidase [Lachnospiraceae bacterium]|nr:M18 family aminopeptidase [Lachnospiraceae bacterium]
MKQCLKYLSQSTCPFLSIRNAVELLQDAGFQEINYEQTWNFSSGKYFLNLYDSFLVAFTLPKSLEKMKSIHLALAHDDSPAFKLKSQADMIKSDYHTLNVEMYGGMLPSTWFDRPLGLSGKLFLKGENVFSPVEKIFDIKEGGCIIPSLAPHLSRSEKNAEPNPQKEYTPIFSVSKDETSSILDFLAEKTDSKKENILTFDITLYNKEEGELIGANQELLSAPRIDNLISVIALLEAITTSGNSDTLNMISIFHHEEIGSRSKEGADSNTLKMCLDKLLEDQGIPSGRYPSLLQNSIMLSVDGAHGLHPNYVEKHDPTNPVILNQGIALKSSSSQRYVTDARVTAIIKALCEENNIPYQEQVNKTGMAGGQTLGPIVSSYLPIPAIDLGVPILGMHSARELCGCDDYESLKKLLKVFFSTI